MLLLRNPIQPYAWGPRDGVAEVLGTEPTGGHEAELWVGTHERGSSVVVGGEHHDRPLAEVVAEDPGRWLGIELARAGWTGLPFLLKVLAIAEPLSLQAHPSAEQARAGYEREERAGINLDAPNRTYRDPSAKPEALVAVAPTVALCGFRPPHVAGRLISELGLVELAPLVKVLDASPPSLALADALAWVLQLHGAERTALAGAVLAAADRRADRGTTDPAPSPWPWVIELGRRHPGDPGCLAPLLLEVVELAPGEAVHLPAGNLHAYLRGVGVEIMASSDNVLRGGLTPKHIDVDELLRVLVFEAGCPPAPVARTTGPITRYDCGEEAFSLARVDAADAPVEVGGEGPSLLLPVGRSASGSAAAICTGSDGTIEVGPGQAVLLAAGERATVTAAVPVWWATPGP